MPLPPITTPRLQIRELVSADRAAMLAFVHQPDQLAWMSIAFDTNSILDDFLAEATKAANSRSRKDFHLTVSDGGTDAYLGTVSLMTEEGTPFAAELGYFFLRQFWGRGYAREACQAVLDLGFSGLELHRIWGKCHVDNLASARVMASIGMTHEGTLHDHCLQRGQYRSSHLYAMLEADWRANH